MLTKIEGRTRYHLWRNITGKSIFKGIAIGKILFYQKGEQPVKRVKIEDTAEQIKRYEDARAKAAEQLQGLYEKGIKKKSEKRMLLYLKYIR